MKCKSHGYFPYSHHHTIETMRVAIILCLALLCSLSSAYIRDRVTDGEIWRISFDGTSSTTVADSVGTLSFDLTGVDAVKNETTSTNATFLENTCNTSRTCEAGGCVAASSSTVATSLYEAVNASQEFTIEMWFSADRNQSCAGSTFDALLENITVPVTMLSTSNSSAPGCTHGLDDNHGLFLIGLSNDSVIFEMQWHNAEGANCTRLEITNALSTGDGTTVTVNITEGLEAPVLEIKHIAFTAKKDATGDLAVCGYYQGKLVECIVIPAAIASTDPFAIQEAKFLILGGHIPGFPDGAPGAAGFASHKNYLSSMYSRALNASEIEQNFNAGHVVAPVLAAEPVPFPIWIIILIVAVVGAVVIGLGIAFAVSQRGSSSPASTMLITATAPLTQRMEHVALLDDVHTHTQRARSADAAGKPRHRTFAKALGSRNK